MTSLIKCRSNVTTADRVFSSKTCNVTLGRFWFHLNEGHFLYFNGFVQQHHFTFILSDSQTHSKYNIICNKNICYKTFNKSSSTLEHYQLFTSLFLGFTLNSLSTQKYPASGQEKCSLVSFHINTIKSHTHIKLFLILCLFLTFKKHEIHNIDSINHIPSGFVIS